MVLTCPRKQIIPTLEEEKLYLLPSEVYGFDLVDKRWTAFLVEQLEPVNFDENAWDHLVLDPNIKVCAAVLWRFASGLIAI